MNIDLKNKVALVTGGSRGIGRAIALMLAENGARVAICGRTQESLDDTTTAIRARGTEAWSFQCDVSDNDQLERLMSDVIGATHQLDILVNNAVTSESAPFDQLSDAQFRYHIDVKLMAYIRLARLALPHIAAQGAGRIVNIGGMTARIVAPMRMTNGVVNAGVANFTKQFAGYAAQHKITVNCVHPGYTATERIMQIFRKEADESGRSIDAIVAERTSDIPLGQLIKPEDMAAAVLFFCAPAAAMVTGQCLAVDGGSGAAVAY